MTQAETPPEQKERLRRKVKAFRERKKKVGLVEVSVMIPSGRIAELRKIAKKMVEKHLAELEASRTANLRSDVKKMVDTRLSKLSASRHPTPKTKE